MKEDDAMVYRNPYLTSGASGFALNAISRAMKKELKVNPFFLSYLIWYRMAFLVTWKLQWKRDSYIG